MLQAEYVRNLNCNYERILLERKPEENRYQYCIMARNQMKRLLPCSLRYLNGQAYLYYDISSTQNICQLYAGRNIERVWVKDFFWSVRQVRQELEKYLLEDKNLIWHPEQVFQDIEKSDFRFLYIPYYEGKNDFVELLNFLVERIDYSDEMLVECVYTMHEKYEMYGVDYLQEQIFEEVKMLEEQMTIASEEKAKEAGYEEVIAKNKEEKGPELPSPEKENNPKNQ